jgi:uncharacterized membrane protein YkvA (DUF1232 family)
MSNRSHRTSGGRKSRQSGGLRESLPIKFFGLWNDIKTMLAMLMDYISGRYVTLPLKTIIAMIGAILYFVSPIDFIPDFIPFVGYIDDFFVVVLAIDLVRDDLKAYRAWQDEGGRKPDGTV